MAGSQTAPLVVTSLSPSFGKFDRRPVDLLAENGMEVRFADPYAPTDEDIAVADVFVAGVSPINDDIMARAPRLRLIAKHGVGIENIDLSAARDRGIDVTNMPGAGTHAVAELVFAHILAAARGLVRVDRQVRRGAWPAEIGIGLRGRVLGIVGTGRIGQAVGEIGRGFGMRLVAYDPFPSEDFVASGADYRPLPEVLRAADVVTLHVPLTPDTRHLIGAEELRQMKPSAILVNASRGATVDEDALVEALVNGELAGAGLDVHETEPTPNTRLLQLDSVTVTSHVGAYTMDSLAEVSAATAENILRIAAGHSPLHIVNLASDQPNRL